MKPPRLLSDLYADLRDRKLLPLVVILPIAIVAIPVVLGQDSAPPAPPTAADLADMPAGAPTAAVLTSTPSLRDYRERLDQLRSKNPFAGQEASTDTPEDGEIIETTTGGTATATATGGTSSFSETFNETVSSSTSGQTTEDDVTVEVDGPDAGEPEDVPESGDSGGQWYEYQIDVEAGPAGDTNKRNNLDELTVLPSKSNPVAVYLGIASGGKEAVFMVSPDVVGVSGGGSCSPSPENCQLLTMKKGEEEKFDYAPTGEPDTFVIEVKDIRFVPVKNPVERSREAGSVDAEAAASGARTFLGD